MDELKEPDLLDYIPRGLARSTDPKTAWEAAALVDAPKGEALVIDTLIQHGPHTQQELAKRFGKPADHLGPRFKPLLERNIIEVRLNEDGTQVTRAGDSGRPRLVYQIQPDTTLWKERPQPKKSLRVELREAKAEIERLQKFLDQQEKTNGKT